MRTSLATPCLLLLVLAGCSSTPNFESSFSPSQTPAGRILRDSLEGLVIVVDPGHGGSDLGSKGIKGVPEKQINLAIARDLGRHLQHAIAEEVRLA